MEGESGGDEFVVKQDEERGEEGREWRVGRDKKEEKKEVGRKRRVALKTSPHQCLCGHVCTVLVRSLVDMPCFLVTM